MNAINQTPRGKDAQDAKIDAATESDSQTDAATGKPGGAQQEIVSGNAIKDPSEWTTGAEPITGAQKSYLHTLAREAGETIDDNLSKAGASEKIDELQEKTGRGK